MTSALPRGDIAFFGGCALVFVAGAGATVRLCAPMGGGMGMPGGWTLSMAWMPMAGRGWVGAWAMFAGTWAVSMVAMMLPAIAPALRGYWGAAGDDDGSVPGVRTLAAAAGYFSVWAALGAALFPAGALLAEAAMRAAPFARAVPWLAATTLLAAGALQLSEWKARRLERCRSEAACAPAAMVAGAPCCAGIAAASRARARPTPGEAWRDGLRLGGHCALCCCGLMAALLAVGAMDLRAMAAIGTAIAGERLLPWPARVARAIGAGLIALGVMAGARAVGIG